MLTLFRPVIKSRHPSHSILRRKNSKLLPLLPFKSVVRFGSTTDVKDTVSNGGNRLEVNTIEAIKNSSNKLLMKNCFEAEKVKTADWWIYGGEWDGVKAFINRNIVDEPPVLLDDLPFPIISKHIFGSRGTGNTKHDTKESLEKWLEGKDLTRYIFEKFHNYVREYRLHVTERGCFYSCRKMLKQDTPEEARWYRNDDHCVWIMEENELFDKPINWDNVVEHSVNALKSVGLDIGAVDLKIQSSNNKKGEKRKDPKFIVIEINSAPSFGEVTTTKYIGEIPELLKFKANK